MKKLLLVFSVFVALLLGGLPAGAETSEIMDGSIGKYGVVMQLDLKNNGKVTGWYYYKSKGSSHKISLSGTYTHPYNIENYYILKLTESVDGKVTGNFEGEYFNGPIYQYSGTWESPKGTKLKFFINNSPKD